MTIRDSDDPGPTLARFVAAAAPELLGAGIGGLAQLAGADPITGNVTAVSIAMALRLDLTRREDAIGRAGYTTHLAAEALGGTERLEQLALAGSYQRELTGRVLAAAARTPLEAKLPALARVLANGLDGSTKIDRAFIYAAALDDLEAPDVQVLSAVAHDDPGPDEIGAPGAGWTEWQIAKRLPSYEPVLAVVLRTLDRHALIRDITAGTYGGPVPRYVASTVGTDVLALLE
jgi:hypothetical protein